MKVTLMYAPTLYQWDTDRAVAPETWYYRWQKRLWSYFVSRADDLDVVWKVGKGNMCEDPAREWRAPNVRYSSAPMWWELQKVDRVFVDTLSNTVIWDASKARVPVLCCYLRTDRKVLLSVEGKLHIYFCSSAEEVFAWLDRFIAGELKPLFLAPTDSDWLEKLERRAGR